MRWWDPSATTGPLEASDLPLSQELRRDFDGLRDALAELATERDERRGFERVESDWQREALQAEVVALWRRARAELGPRYAVGFQRAGMRRPVWSPSELGEDDDASCDIPF